MSLTKTKIIVVLGGWILIVAPGIFLGYGGDDDAWRNARTAEQIWETGEYVRTRTTGFPVYEIAITPLVVLGGWTLSNLFSLSSGVLLLAAIFRLWSLKHLKHPLLYVLATAFIPIVVKSSSSTMDFIPALSVLMWAYVKTVQRRWFAASVLIGLAAGIRPSSILMLGPVLYYARSSGARYSDLLRITALT
jgi:hypothetical protein